jgi:Na+-driven multidrug efflux pump
VTDGFFAAYGVFVVLMLAASALRLVFLPPLARARLERRLGLETAAWAVALGALVVPLLVVAVVLAGPAATVLTGFGPEAARNAAKDVLPLMVLAAVAQLFAGLAASALAALDDYLTAAVSYIVASVVGLAYIVARIDADGIDAVATGMALNGLLAVTLPTVALARRARGEAMPRSGVRPSGPPLPHRLLRMLRSAELTRSLSRYRGACVTATIPWWWSSTQRTA